MVVNSSVDVQVMEKQLQVIQGPKEASDKTKDLMSTPFKQTSQNHGASGAGDTKYVSPRSEDNGATSKFAFDLASVAFVSQTSAKAHVDMVDSNEPEGGTDTPPTMKQNRSLDEKSKIAYGYVVKPRRMDRSTTSLTRQMDGIPGGNSAISDNLSPGQSAFAPSDARVFNPLQSSSPRAVSIDVVIENQEKSSHYDRSFRPSSSKNRPVPSTDARSAAHCASPQVLKSSTSRNRSAGFPDADGLSATNPIRGLPSSTSMNQKTSVYARSSGMSSVRHSEPSLKNRPGAQLRTSGLFAPLETQSKPSPSTTSRDVPQTNLTAASNIYSRPSPPRRQTDSSLDTLRANLLKATPMTAPTIDRHPLIQEKVDNDRQRDAVCDISEQTIPSSQSTIYQSQQQELTRSPVFVGHRLPQVVNQPRPGTQIAEPVYDAQRQTAAMTAIRPHVNMVQKGNSLGTSTSNIYYQRPQNAMSPIMPCYYSQQFAPTTYAPGNPWCVNPKTSPVARRDQHPNAYQYFQGHNQNMYVSSPMVRNQHPGSNAQTIQYRIHTNHYRPIHNPSTGNEGKKLFSTLQMPNRRNKPSTVNPQFKVPSQRMVPVQSGLRTREAVSRACSLGSQNQFSRQRSNYSTFPMAQMMSTNVRADVMPHVVQNQHKYPILQMDQKRSYSRDCAPSRPWDSQRNFRHVRCQVQDRQMLRSQTAPVPQLNFNNDNRFHDDVTEQRNPDGYDERNMDTGRRDSSKAELFSPTRTMPRLSPQTFQSETSITTSRSSNLSQGPEKTNVLPNHESTGRKLTQVSNCQTDVNDKLSNDVHVHNLRESAETTEQIKEKCKSKAKSVRSTDNMQSSDSEVRAKVNTSLFVSGETTEQIKEKSTSKAKSVRSTNNMQSSDSEVKTNVKTSLFEDNNNDKNVSCANDKKSDKGEVIAKSIPFADKRKGSDSNDCSNEPNNSSTGDTDRKSKVTSKSQVTKVVHCARHSEYVKAPSESDNIERASKARVPQQAPLFKKALKMLQTHRRILSKPGHVIPGPVPQEEQQHDVIPKSAKSPTKGSSFNLTSTQGSQGSVNEKHKRPKFRIKRRQKSGKKGRKLVSKTPQKQEIVDLTKDTEIGKRSSLDKTTKVAKGQPTNDNDWLVMDGEDEGDKTVHYHIRKDAGHLNNRRLTRAKSNAESDDYTKNREPQGVPNYESFTEIGIEHTNRKTKTAKASKRRKLRKGSKDKEVQEKHGSELCEHGKPVSEDSASKTKIATESHGRRLTSTSLSARAWEECREVTLEQWRQRAIQEGLPKKKIEEITKIENTDGSVEKRNGPPDFQEMLVKTWQDVIVKSTQKIEGEESDSDRYVFRGGTRKSKAFADDQQGQSHLIDLTEMSRFDIFVKNIIENAERECDLTPSNDDDESSGRSSPDRPDWQTWEKEVKPDTNRSRGNELTAQPRVLVNFTIDEGLDVDDAVVVDEEVAKITSTMGSGDKNYDGQEGKHDTVEIQGDKFQIEPAEDSHLRSSECVNEFTDNNDYGNINGQDPVGYRVQWHLDEDAGNSDPYFVPCAEEIVFSDEHVWIGEIQTDIFEFDTEVENEQQQIFGTEQRTKLVETESAIEHDVHQTSNSSGSGSGEYEKAENDAELQQLSSDDPRQKPDSQDTEEEQTQNANTDANGTGDTELDREDAEVDQAQNLLGLEDGRPDGGNVEVQNEQDVLRREDGMTDAKPQSEKQTSTDKDYEEDVIVDQE